VLIANETQFYNPVTAAWVNTGAFAKTAENPIRASLLNKGNVLASGSVCAYSGCGHVPTSACFLYTPSTNSWSIAGSMNQARVGHTSTLLPSGKVLVAGVSRVFSVGVLLFSAPLSFIRRSFRIPTCRQSRRGVANLKMHVVCDNPLGASVEHVWSVAAIIHKDNTEFQIEDQSK
jgi:hypothetical protein